MTSRWIIAAFAIAIFSNLLYPSTDKPLLGFKQTQDQLALESKFDSYLKAENLRTWMQHLSARPHHTSSPYDKQNAEYMAGLFKSWGYETQIESFKSFISNAEDPGCGTART